MNDVVRRVAVAISGAPFPSQASMRKARAAIKAMRYVDGTDEDQAIAAGRVEGMDPAMLICAYDSMLQAVLASDE